MEPMKAWEHWVARRAERYERVGRLAYLLTVPALLLPGLWYAHDAIASARSGNEAAVLAGAAAGCLLTAASFLLLDEPVLRVLARLYRASQADERPSPRPAREPAAAEAAAADPRDRRMLEAARQWEESGSLPAGLFVLLGLAGLAAIGFATLRAGAAGELPASAAAWIAAAGGLASGAALLGLALTRWVRLAARLGAEGQRAA